MKHTIANKAYNRKNFVVGFRIAGHVFLLHVLLNVFKSCNYNGDTCINQTSEHLTHIGSQN